MLPELAQREVRGRFSEQSEFAQDFLDLFRHVVLDEPYRLRLRRHYRVFREELARRQGAKPQ